MKKRIIFFIVILLMLLGISYKVYSDARQIIKNPFTFKEDSMEITIKPGDNLSSVLNTLNEENKIGNAYLIKWYIKKQNLNTGIRPGTYKIPKDMILEEFLNVLAKGSKNENAVIVTIPEGYDIEKIAALLQEKGVTSKEEFLKSCKEYPLPNYIKADEKRRYALEGYMFPDTYELLKNMSGKDIIELMLKNYQDMIKKAQDEAGKAVSGEELDKIMVIASMIEREAEAVEERPVIASVLYNRLNIKMKLQIDATVEYALGVHKTIYTYKDIEVQSPYNTYVVNGLPVGPICNPGKASIKAALAPASSKYLYYVSKFDGSKTHFFSENYDKFLNDKKTSEANYAKMKK